MATYVTKRKLMLRPVLDKKKGIEEATNFLKQRQEAEADKLNKLKSEFDSVSLELQEINDEFKKIEDGSNEIGQAVLDYIEKARSSILETDDLLDLYIKVIKEFELKIQVQQEELGKIKAYQEVVQTEISNEDKRLENKRNDIEIYEKRLRKKINDAGLENEIKVILP